VNNGVLRKNEFQSVQKNLRDKLGLNIVAVDASERFLESWPASPIPNQAQAHRREFIAVFDDEASASSKETAGWTGWCRARSIPT
jgi:GMP synthase (glutamine-hydrolysing)